MIPRDFWIYLKCLVFLNTFSAPLIQKQSYSHKIVFASHRTTLLISDDFIIWCPVGFLRPVLLRIELSFRGLKKDYYCRVLIYIASSMLCTTENWNNVDVL